MSLQRVADRYARSLEAVLQDDSDLEPALDALQRFNALYSECDDLRTVLSSPATSPVNRMKVLVEILERDEFPPVAANLMRVLLRRGRIRALPAVTDIYAKLVDERLNRVEAVVTTAIALSSEQEEMVREGLAHFTSKSVRLITKIDPDIIGGVVVQCEGKIVDGSLRTRLDRLKEAVLA